MIPLVPRSYIVHREPNMENNDMTSDDTAANEQTVRDFIRTAFTEGRAQDALDLYVGDRYIQHNPGVPDGSEGFIQAVKDSAGTFPNFLFEIRRAIAHEDYVVLHSYLTVTGEGPGFAVMDIFRLEDGKIVEHWDVVQAIPEDPANDNTMF
jgi:predicted SnoaL-like aldol condensation-catalyzing enzyme